MIPVTMIHPRVTMLLRHFSTAIRNLCHVHDVHSIGAAGSLQLPSKTSTDDGDSKLAEEARRIGILKLEFETFRQSGEMVPEIFPESAWQEILELNSRSQRKKFYKFLCIKERQRSKSAQKKLEKRHIRELEAQNLAAQDSNARTFNAEEYGLSKNTMHLFLRESTMLQTYNHWQINAMQFGPKLVYDMGYDEDMTKAECKNTAEQMMEVYAANRVYRQQFHLMLCNARWDLPTMKYLDRFLPNLRNDNCLLDVTEKSYLDLFSKEQLVYLTPHCNTPMKRYNPQIVYVIGGIVDKSVQAAVSLAKAKREGITMQKLPIDDYLDWGLGAKTLTLDQMMKIMLDIKETGDWNLAFKHVPKRKMKEVASVLDRKQRHGPAVKSLFDENSKRRW